MSNPKIPTLPTSFRSEIGGSGTWISPGGFISGEEYNRNLIGRFGLQNYDIMGRSDGTIHAALQVCKNPIVAAHWSFKPASQDPIDMEANDFLNREFFNRAVDFYAVMEEGLTCLDFGHAVDEICYEPTTFNNQFRWGLQKLASRKQNSILSWQMSDDKPGIRQLLPFGPLKDIPMQKLVIFTNEKRGENYEGISMLRFAYKHWYLKDKLELMNAVALERMAIGVPIIRKGQTKNGPTNLTVDPTAVEALKDALRQLRANEESYLEEPIGVLVEMLDMKGHTTKDVLPTITYEDTQVLLSVLAQFLGLGVNGNSGARALSQDHSKLFLKALEAVARVMQRGFQSVANRLTDLNYSNLPNGYPKLTFDNLDDDDVAIVSTALSAMVTAGVITPGVEVENRGRTLVNIPETTPEDYEAKQQVQQAQAAKIAKQQAQMQQQPNQDLPNDTENNPADDPKAKLKEEKLTAAWDTVDELYKLIADPNYA
jgi:phage gp29-like protein